PDDSRSKVLGRRLVIVNFAAMMVGYGAGKFIDMFPGTHLTFVVPYIAACICGVAGYLILGKIPFPSILHVEGEITLSRALAAPFRNQAFRRLFAFLLVLTFGGLVAEPFYNVFMIRDLGVRYSTIAVLNAINLGSGILGYWMWGVIAARFGNKPILQLLMVPRLLLPFLWILLTPANQGVVLVLIMIFTGITYSGITVAINTLLFGGLAEVKDRSPYFAIWSLGSALVVSLATASGGVLTRITSSLDVTVLGLQFDNIRLMFTISGFLLILPIFVLRRVHDTEAKPVTHLLGQVFRGNPLSFVYNSFVYSRTRQNRSRARAARNMGKSKSPMAVDSLARAMDDADPGVREEAVKGLGNTKAPEAVRHLADALENEESDVQAEAAAALGKLKNPEGIAPLLKALDSEDVRVGISAARALGVIGGVDVGDHLYARAQREPGKMFLPALVESLSVIGDVRAVEIALSSLHLYRNPVIRLQLINASCRALGARDIFYKLLSKNSYALAEKLDQMLQTIGRRLRRLHGERKDEALAQYEALSEALLSGKYGDMAEIVPVLGGLIAAENTTSQAALQALNLFQTGTQGSADRPEIFFLVTLGIVADASL
ncbi:MAG: hypothetical protein HN368_05855, partial [Spirochaetales bacterium]|nr:hypothetical protein [Spirochaetales bacterium]